MAECGPFWKAGRAAGELDIDRVVELQLTGECGKLVSFRRAVEIVNAIERKGARRVVTADRDDETQIRQPRRAQSAG